jgi:sulfate transport system permease protein
MSREGARGDAQANAPRMRQPRLLPGFGLTVGFTSFFLSAIVLLPLGALVLKALGMHWHAFWATLLDPRAVASYRLTFGASLVAAGINAVFGFIVAWSLVRYEFPGRRIIDALIDMPFALPTAVSGIALTAVLAENGWIGGWLAHYGIKVAYTPLGVVVALTLIGMPFMVRTVQPALAEVERDLEDVAETLGASRFQILHRIILPAVLPAILTGFTLAFARAVGEYGSVIFISGNLPMRTEITPLLIVVKLEQFDYAGAAALGFAMLVIAFVMLFVINVVQAWGRRRFVVARH